MNMNSKFESANQGAPKNDEEILKYGEEAEAVKAENTHREIMGGDAKIVSRAGVIDKIRMAVREKMTFWNAEKGKNEAVENLAERLLDKDLGVLEKNASKLEKLSKKADKQRTKREGEIAKMEADLEQSIARGQKDLELLQSSGLSADIAGLRSKLGIEAEEKEGAIRKFALRRGDKEQEAEKLKSDLENRKEAIRKPVSEKMMDINISLDKYGGQLKDLQERKEAFAGKIAKNREILEALSSHHSVKADKERLKGMIRADEERMKRFAEAEKKLNKRIEAVRGEKQKVHDHLRRIDMVGVKGEAKEKAADERLESFRLVEGLPEDCGGPQAFRRIMGALPPGGKEIIDDYMRLSAADRNGMPEERRLDISSLKGKSHEEIKGIFSEFVGKFDRSKFARKEEEWAELFLGDVLSKADYKKADLMKKALERMPKNVVSNKYSAEWATRLYVEYRKLGEASADEKILILEAKNIIQNGSFRSANNQNI